MYSGYIIELSHKLANALYDKYRAKYRGKRDRESAIERSVRAIADALIKFPTHDTLMARICSELKDIEGGKLKDILDVIEKLSEVEDPEFYTRLAINIPYLVMGYVKAGGGESE